MNRNLIIGTFLLSAAVAVVAISYSGSGSSPDLSAAAAAPAPDSRETLVFMGTQEDLANVAFTIKPEATGDVLVYQGRPRGGAKPYLVLRRGPGYQRILRGGISGKKALVFNVMPDPDGLHSFLVGPGAGTKVRQAVYTVDNSGKRVCLGYRCAGNIAFTWSGAATGGRSWIYTGSAAAGRENVRFTLRGPVDHRTLALIPVLAGQ